LGHLVSRDSRVLAFEPESLPQALTHCPMTSVACPRKRNTPIYGSHSHQESETSSDSTAGRKPLHIRAQEANNKDMLLITVPFSLLRSSTLDCLCISASLVRLLTDTCHRSWLQLLLALSGDQGFAMRIQSFGRKVIRSKSPFSKNRAMSAWQSMTRCPFTIHPNPATWTGVSALSFRSSCFDHSQPRPVFM
jgi:hypothetical protein